MGLAEEKLVVFKALSAVAIARNNLNINTIISVQ